MADIPTVVVAVVSLATGVFATVFGEWVRRRRERPQGASVKWNQACDAQRRLLFLVGVSLRRANDSRATEDLRVAVSEFATVRYLLPIRQGADAVARCVDALRAHEKWIGLGDAPPPELLVANATA